MFYIVNLKSRVKNKTKDKKHINQYMLNTVALPFEAI